MMIIDDDDGDDDKWCWSMILKINPDDRWYMMMIEDDRW